MDRNLKGPVHIKVGFQFFVVRTQKLYGVNCITNSKIRHVYLENRLHKNVKVPFSGFQNFFPALRRA